jgi:hypothetical protein
MLYASRNVSEELYTVFQDDIIVVSYVKSSPVRGKRYAKQCDMEAEHTALLYDCETSWFSYIKLLHRVLELKEEIAIFKRHKFMLQWKSYSETDLVGRHLKN